jgi:aspartyl-tRNA(Asn)/glutamyl-tRNA(Gln) amidotransferase subunit A
VRTPIEIAEAVRRGDLKATEVLDECLTAIETGNPALNAFVHLDAELAHRAASEVDALVSAGEDPGPLAGVPMGVKDLEDCAGMPTSKGSLLFKGRPPVASDSVHVARLRAAGAVPVGKTAAPEFGAVAFTSTPAWGTTRNPWNPSRTPGGSSGGSAAAVAGGLVPFCTASDGGGSTRIPAAFCGLVGLKPSQGRIPHPGNQPSQTATFGALVTTVADCARHLDVVAGPSDLDRVSLPASGICYEQAIEQLDVAGLRAAWSPDLGFALVDPEVAGVAEAAALDLARAAELKLVDRPIHLTDPVRTWLSQGVLDMWNDIEPDMWPARADELDVAARRALSLTEETTAPRAARIWMRRGQLERELAAVYEDIDVLLTPTTAVVAFAAEGPMPSRINGEKVHPAMNVPFTMLGNLCWNPAISVPAGLSADGLPIGLQIMGRRHADEVVLRLARLFEQARPWPTLAPASFAAGQ